MRLRNVLLCAWLVTMPAAIAASAAQPPPGDFVPVDESRPGEEIPALPLIAAAYGFIWVVLLSYVWTIGRRLQKVEAELSQLESRKG
jgi:CcmD family protein